MATLISFHISSIRRLSARPAPSATKRPLAVLSSDRKMRVPYELKQGQSRLFHELPSGLSMEVIAHKGAEPRQSTGNPPLVFLHGSYHAACGKLSSAQLRAPSIATLISFHISSIRRLPARPAPSATKRPLAVLSSDRKMRVSYELRQGQSRLFHELPSGLSMEVIAQKGAEP